MKLGVATNSFPVLGSALRPRTSRAPIACSNPANTSALVLSCESMLANPPNTNVYDSARLTAGNDRTSSVMGTPVPWMTVASKSSPIDRS